MPSPDLVSQGRLGLLHHLGTPQNSAPDPSTLAQSSVLVQPPLTGLFPLSTQKHAGFSCSSFVPDGPSERAPSLPPHSPSIASPGPEQGHCPAGPGPGPFRLSPSDKYPAFGFEEGPASSPGRFLKGSHVPFHPYKRHFQEDIFPEAQAALALDGHSFKTPEVLEAFEEIPVDVGEAEAYLPGFSAEAWCNGLPYPSQEHSPQVLVSTSGQWASHLPSVPAPSSPDKSSEIELPTFPFQTFPLRVSVHQGSSKPSDLGSLGFILGLQVIWGRDAGLVQLGGEKMGEAGQAKEAGSFPEAPESGFQCVTSLCLFKCKNPQPDLHAHMQM